MNSTARTDQPSITIVVPARNEARNLEIVLPTLPDVHEVIVVDGHSSDDSASVVARVLPQARFLQQTRRGKGNALAVGFEAATGDIIVMFDADGSADAGEISAYVNALLTGADFAKGSRVLGEGGSEDITWLRDLGNRGLTALTNTVFRTRYTDLCYGYNAFWRDILPALALPSSHGEEPQWGDGFEIETMINCRVAARDLQIHEVPSVELERIHGESNLNTWRDGFRVLRTIGVERLSHGRAASPVPSADVISAHPAHPAAPVAHNAEAPAGLVPAQRSRVDAEARSLHVLQGSGGQVPATTTSTVEPTPRVMVVGSGWRFTSGISYYTCRLANALSTTMSTDALLMRQLVPTALYPGRARVGQKVNAVDYADAIEVYDGVDWFWGPSMSGAIDFIDTQHPDVVVLQWWTGAVLHSYRRIAAHARRRGARVVMEWHEVQDTGEARIPGVTRYVRGSMGRLLGLVDAHVVHSAYDLALLQRSYGFSDEIVERATVVPHGPYDHVRSDSSEELSRPVVTDPAPFNLLYFGVIRPYKGLEDLVEAFSNLPEEVRALMHLTIVGETWERWTAPLEAVEASPARDQITVVNRYVTDDEASLHFAAADAVVLPYRRSSSSGPLHMAMSMGLPTVVTAVGGLVDAASGYEGITFVPPADIEALTAALLALPDQWGRRYPDPHSWDTTVDAYREILAGFGLVVPVADRASDGAFDATGSGAADRTADRAVAADAGRSVDTAGVR